MSRLRRLNRKLGYPGDDGNGDDVEYFSYATLKEQVEIINEFKNSTQDDHFLGSKFVRVSLMGFQSLIILVCTFLITLPAYRHNGNSLYSFIAVTSSFLSFILLQSYGIKLLNGDQSRRLLDTLAASYDISKFSLATFNLVYSLMLVAFKWKHLNGTDIIYIYPLLMSIIVETIVYDQRNIQDQIDKLENLKTD
ncbi:hypothetical protein LJB42_000473 [Komagataella kurtzmanii]|nr:hypothetical protein LJB42_000473 [Komagataella kurtzmanii]